MLTNNQESLNFFKIFLANFIFPFLWLHCLNKAKIALKWKCPVEFRDRESTQIVSGRSGFGELYRGDLKRGKKKATFPFFGNVAWQSVRSVCGLRLVPFSANHKKANHRKAISFFLNIFYYNSAVDWPNFYKNSPQFILNDFTVRRDEKTRKTRLR